MPEFTVHTLGSLLEAQPAQCAAVAADTGGAGGAGVEGDGPDHQGKGERQIQAARNVHVHLQAGERPKMTGGYASKPFGLDGSPENKNICCLHELESQINVVCLQNICIRLHVLDKQLKASSAAVHT